MHLYSIEFTRMVKILLLEECLFLPHSLVKLPCGRFPPWSSLCSAWSQPERAKHTHGERDYMVTTITRVCVSKLNGH